MKHSVYILIFLVYSVLQACTSDNTDTQDIVNETPVELQVKIDSIAPVLDSMFYGKAAVSCFFELGSETFGKLYIKSGYESVHSTIIDVLNNHGENGSDILLLIDQTGSMANDIDSVKTNFNLIIDQIKSLKDIRLAIGTYGDHLVDGNVWYSLHGLTSDLTQCQDFLQSIAVRDGGDYPESVYEAIALSIDSLQWRVDTKKTILVIGDAPGLEPPASNYSRDSIIDLCNSNDIQANIFPILVTNLTLEYIVEYGNYYSDIIANVFPNPIGANENLTLKTQYSKSFMIDLIDMSGKVYYSNSFDSDEYQFNIPSHVPSGTYILRVSDSQNGQYNAEKILIK